MLMIRDCMKTKVVGVKKYTTMAEAAKLLVEKHVGMLPVTDEEDRLVGMLSLADMLNLFLPDFVKLVDNIDFVRDFGASEVLRIDPEVRRKPIVSVMDEPVSVEESAGLLRAYTMLLKHKIHDLPVVDTEGKLVGIASRVDIGTAFLSGWRTEPLAPPPTE